ncbi:MAG: DUF58 domain-containing protein [Deltaproteobacteria bacterium]
MSEPQHLIPPRCSAHAGGFGRWPAAFASRFFLALVVGFVWLGPAWWDWRFGAMVLVWDAVVLAIWWFDWSQLPRPAKVEISRVWSEPVLLGVSSSVRLEVKTDSGVRIAGTVEDEVPQTLHRLPPKMNVEATPGRPGIATYDFQPRERGDARWGRVFLAYHSPLRFAERRAVADVAQTVRVYPNFNEAKKLSLYLLRSRQIEIEKRLQHRRERGREFESLREYRDGDEPRDICWTATARRAGGQSGAARLITKVYRAERSQQVFLVMDAGRLMLARTGELTKLDYAVTAALSLAHVAMAGGDSVGMIAYGRKIQSQLNAARGPAQLRAMLEQLALVRGELVEADHARAVEALLSRQRRRSLVVWVTDLAETAATPEVIENAQRVASRHLVLFVAMGQPDLRELVARRPESPAEMYRYAAGVELVERREVLLRRLREQGALALEIQPGKLAVGIVNQYLQVKERSLL